MPYKLTTAITTDFGVKAFTAFCLATISPHYSIIIIMLSFLVVDFITGIYASYKNKEKIVSHRLRETIEKFCFYSIGIIAAIFFQSIFIPAIPLGKIVAGFISAIELLSIYENIRKITGKDIGGIIKEYLKDFIKLPAKKKK